MPATKENVIKVLKNILYEKIDWNDLAKISKLIKDIIKPSKY